MRNVRSGMRTRVQSDIVRNFDSGEERDRLVDLLRERCIDYTDKETNRRNIFSKNDPRSRIIARTVIAPELELYHDGTGEDAFFYYIRGLSVMDATMPQRAFVDEPTQTMLKSLNLNVFIGRHIKDRVVRTMLTDSLEPGDMVILAGDAVIDLRRGLSHRGRFSNGTVRSVGTGSYLVRGDPNANGRRLALKFEGDTVCIGSGGDMFVYTHAGAIRLRYPELVNGS